MFDGARILVAPLDWGLGHAARCVPVIRALLEQDAVPVIGADKGPLALLCQEFPELDHVRIPGMEVRYAAGSSQAWAITSQFPAMLRQMRTEQRSFHRLRRDRHLDAVISDQRFGIRAGEIPSVLITHQVFPFTPFAQRIARRINRRHIDRFDRCWIPDRADGPGLSGALAHGPDLPGNTRFIGPLSRFPGKARYSGPSGYRVVAIISGPEPQRTIFEEKVIAQLRTIRGEHLVVSGRPDAPRDVWSGHVRVVGHLDTDALRGAIMGAELIVSRAGYTTLMDLHALGRSALLVPTPGQSEQEYLAGLHAALGGNVVQVQHELELAKALREPVHKTAQLQDHDHLMDAFSDLAALIRQRRPSTFTR